MYSTRKTFEKHDLIIASLQNTNTEYFILYNCSVIHYRVTYQMQPNIFAWPWGKYNLRQAEHIIMLCSVERQNKKIKLNSY